MLNRESVLNWKTRAVLITKLSINSSDHLKGTTRPVGGTALRFICPRGRIVLLDLRQTEKVTLCRPWGNVAVINP